MFIFKELYDAFEENDVCAQFDLESGSFINIEKEKILYLPPLESADEDERQPIIQEMKTGQWIQLPRKRELCPGKKIIFDFAAEHLTDDEQDFVDTMFSHSGAYRNWRAFLKSKNLLDAWYAFEEAFYVKSLKEWLQARNILFLEATPAKTK